MKEDDLFQHLQEFTEEETFYKQYSAAKCSPSQLEGFISSLDAANLSRHKYVLPELKNSLDLNFISEAWVWNDSDRDIFIHKHPRFMPEWDFVHEFYELIYAYNGSFDLHISGYIIRMEQGFVCLIPPGVHHHISIFDDTIALNSKIRKSTFQSSFSPLLTSNDVIAQFFLNTMYIGDYKDYILFHSKNNKQLHDLFTAIYLEQLNQEKYYNKIMNSLLSIVLTILMRHYEDTLETALSGHNRLRKLESILSFIEANYRTVSLRGLAKEFFFSEQYLSKYIKENSGKTFNTIIREIRLDKARLLLETTDLTISKISDASGYACAEHFMRQFKKQFGASPTEYRRNYIKN